jgi:four helix bundle protein
VNKQLPVASSQFLVARADGAAMGMSYRDLVVWQKAVTLVTDTYRATSKFPRDEQFGLTSQVRRCSVSIPSNMAEGQGRLSEKEFRYFLGQARGSLMELEAQFQIAQNLGYLEPSEAKVLLQSCAEVGRILNGLTASICKES